MDGSGKKQTQPDNNLSVYLFVCLSRPPVVPLSFAGRPAPLVSPHHRPSRPLAGRLAPPVLPPLSLASPPPCVDNGTSRPASRLAPFTGGLAATTIRVPCAQSRRAPTANQRRWKEQARPRRIRGLGRPAPAADYAHGAPPLVSPPRPAPPRPSAARPNPPRPAGLLRVLGGWLSADKARLWRQ